MLYYSEARKFFGCWIEVDLTLIVGINQIVEMVTMITNDCKASCWLPGHHSMQNSSPCSSCLSCIGTVNSGSTGHVVSPPTMISYGGFLQATGTAAPLATVPAGYSPLITPCSVSTVR
jgi:hypothetical protein